MLSHLTVGLIEFLEDLHSQRVPVFVRVYKKTESFELLFDVCDLL